MWLSIKKLIGKKNFCLFAQSQEVLTPVEAGEATTVQLRKGLGLESSNFRAEHLRFIAAYLEAALEDGDPKRIASVLGDIARAKGMTQIAKATGLNRESLYSALSAEGNPTLATFLKVIHALGIQLAAKYPKVKASA